MRRIILQDVVATAQLLARSSVEDRPAELQQLLAQADAADRFFRRFGRPHPQWGNGCLLSRALADGRGLLAEDHHYWASLGLVATAIATRRRGL